MRSYTIKITMLEEELELLKNALKSYAKGDKYTINDLLSMIECQESKQNEKTNKIETSC